MASLRSTLLWSAIRAVLSYRPQLQGAGAFGPAAGRIRPFISPGCFECKRQQLTPPSGGSGPALPHSAVFWLLNSEVCRPEHAWVMVARYKLLLCTTPKTQPAPCSHTRWCLEAPSNPTMFSPARAGCTGQPLAPRGLSRASKAD